MMYSLAPQLPVEMDSDGDEATLTNIPSGLDSNDADLLIDNEMIPKRKLSDVADDDGDVDVDMNNADDKRVRLFTPLDAPDDIDMLPETKDLEQRAQLLEFGAHSYRQLAESCRLDLQSSEEKRHKIARRLKETKSERDHLQRELIYHQEDTAAIVKQLHEPWTRFLQVYNDMRLPADERLHEGSLEMLLAHVLDAKLRQVVDRAAREHDTVAGGQSSDATADGNAIMLQLPIRELAGLSLDAGDGEDRKDGEQMGAGNGKARGKEGKGEAEDEDEEL